MAVDNTTLSGSISGATIELEASINISSDSDKQFRGNGTGRLYRAVNSGSFSPIGPATTLVPSDSRFIVTTVSYTDSAVSNQNTYKYYYSIDIEEEAAGIPV